MAQAKQGDTVKVHYTGKLDDGTVFDTSENREPLEFIIGEGQIIPGFEEVVIGMSVGEKKTGKIPPEKAYGPRREEAVVEVPKSQFPSNVEPEVGQQLQISQENGQTFIVEVAEITDDMIKLDANHPLAGKDLNFDIELVEIA
ncbi:MAG: peptidylprolyl isomerase [Chloroflexi bacterium]|nr:peptidylprolyl isomerase [Chloroflexota bacterium]